MIFILTSIKHKQYILSAELKNYASEKNLKGFTVNGLFD